LIPPSTVQTIQYLSLDTRNSSSPFLSPRDLFNNCHQMRSLSLRVQQGTVLPSLFGLSHLEVLTVNGCWVDVITLFPASIRTLNFIHVDFVQEWCAPPLLEKLSFVKCDFYDLDLSQAAPTLIELRVGKITGTTRTYFKPLKPQSLPMIKTCELSAVLYESITTIVESLGPQLHTLVLCNFHLRTSLIHLASNQWPALQYLRLDHMSDDLIQWGSAITVAAPNLQEVRVDVRLFGMAAVTADGLFRWPRLPPLVNIFFPSLGGLIRPLSGALHEDDIKINVIFLSSGSLPLIHDGVILAQSEAAVIPIHYPLLIKNAQWQQPPQRLIVCSHELGRLINSRPLSLFQISAVDRANQDLFDLQAIDALNNEGAKSKHGYCPLSSKASCICSLSCVELNSE
jgi:hypothetical protein